MENFDVKVWGNKIFNIVNDIFNNKLLFVILAILIIYFIAFVCTSPCYQLQDDFLMRSLIDGSFCVDGIHRDFVMWQNILYCKFLKILYIHCKFIPWYDVFTYFWLTLSATCVLFTLHKKNNLLHNIVLFITVVGLFSVFFIYPQFTLTSGSLVIGATTLFMYIINNDINFKNSIFYSLLIFVMLIIASCIRFECLFFLVPIAGFAILLQVNKNNLKKCIITSILVMASLVSSLGISKIHKNIVLNTPEYKAMYDYHQLRLDITERTFIYQNPDFIRLWEKLEKNYDIDKMLKTTGWTKGAYRSFINWWNIGDEQLFSIKKIEQVKYLMGTNMGIQHKNGLKLNLKFDDYEGVCKYYFGATFILLLLFPSKQATKKSLLFIAFLMLYVAIVEKFLKTLPPRVWINLFTMMLCTCYYYIKLYSDKILTIDLNKYFFTKKQTDYKKIETTIWLLLLCIFVSYISRPYYKYSKVCTWRANIRQEFNKFMEQNFDNKHIYLTDSFVNEIYATPFQKSYLRNYKIIMIMPCFSAIKKNLVAYGIPLNETIKYIVDSNNIYYFSIKNGGYSTDSNKMALSQFMKDYYGKEIAFVPTNKDMKYGVNTFDIVTLTPFEEKVAKNLDKIFGYRDIEYLERGY